MYLSYFGNLVNDCLIHNCAFFESMQWLLSFSKLEEFDTANGDDWVQYIERLKHYFLANEITDASKQH